MQVGAGDYTIKWGDTLSALARRFGTDVRTLARANHIADPDLIYAGARLAVPGGSGRDGGTSSAGRGAAASPSAGSGENAAEIARMYLGQNASSLKADQSDRLPMQAGVPSNICCANFVSAVLIQGGQLPAGLHTNSVARLDDSLRQQGWRTWARATPDRATS